MPMSPPSIKAIFQRSCPNCGGDVSDFRLSIGAPCKKCLPIPDNELLEKRNQLSFEEFLKLMYEELKSRGKLLGLKEKFEDDLRVEDFSKVFEQVVGNKPWSAQRKWARRVLRGISFSIAAPTGTGKTVFGVVMALYLAMKQQKRTLILVPTTVLANQVHQKLVDFLSRLGSSTEVAAYHSLLSKRRKEEELGKMGRAEIVVLTSTFVIRRKELLEGKTFDFVFVDDVDAFLRSSKTFDVVLKAVGVSDSDLKVAEEVLRLRTEVNKAFRRKRGNLNELLSRLEEASRRLRDKREKYGVIVVSGASTRARRTKRVRILRELFNFEVGGGFEGLRKIVDAYLELHEKPEEVAVRLVKRLGGGGLVFVPMHLGLEGARRLKELLEKSGIRAEVFSRRLLKYIEAFKSGKLDVLIGVASYRSPLARGLDLPETVRYAVFVGVPKFVVKLDVEDLSPYKWIALLSNLRDVAPSEHKLRIDYYVSLLRTDMKYLSRPVHEAVVKAIREGEELKGFLGKIKADYEEVLSFLRELVADEEIRKKIAEASHLSLKLDGEIPVLSVADPVGYLQASGRTSRMFAGGLTLGLSIVLVDDEKAFNGLKRDLRWFDVDARWKRLNDLDLDEVLKKIDEDRELVRKITSGERIDKRLVDDIRTVLLVVESPNKARTIARFFGRPQTFKVGSLKVYEVSFANFILMITSTGGHIYDLSTKGGFHGVLLEGERVTPLYTTIKKCLNCGEQTTDPDATVCPRCKLPRLSDKMEVVKSLRELAKDADVLYVGTDADSEGEKIGWDVIQALKPFVREAKRIEFHEVTKRAIMEALRNPKDINERLVEAQIVRRIEDRWIGFELSMKLWNRFESKTLSAGRVQTPVLGWIISRHEEMKREKYDFYYVVLSNGESYVFSAKAVGTRGRKNSQVKKGFCVVDDVFVESCTLNPPPPFSTETMLQEAAARLGMSANECMQLAQDLFEMGFITYHRTDSVRVSGAGIAVAREYVCEKFGEQYFKPRKWGEGGAHECIRPTRPVDSEKLRQLIANGVIKTARPLTRRHFALYDLIFKRFMASQMKEAKVLKQRYSIALLVPEETGEEGVVLSKKELVLLFLLKKRGRLTSKRADSLLKKLGFRSGWSSKTAKKLTAASLVDGDGTLRLSAEGEKLLSRSLVAEKNVESVFEIVEEGFTALRKIRVAKRAKPGVYRIVSSRRRRKPLARYYTQGDIVALMKNKGIGRPSTYAKIISTLIERKYVFTPRKAKILIPTNLGIEVYKYLTEESSAGVRSLVSEQRTRELEEKMKKVEEGKERYVKVLKELYEEIAAL